MGVFPTTVGMNRSWTVARQLQRCVPHDRGDEPRLLLSQLIR